MYGAQKRTWGIASVIDMIAILFQVLAFRVS